MDILVMIGSFRTLHSRKLAASLRESGNFPPTFCKVPYARWWCQRSLRAILSRVFQRSATSHGTSYAWTLHNFYGSLYLFWYGGGDWTKKEEAPLLTSHLLAILLTPFQDWFTRPTWRKALILLEGVLLARGRRTVTAALRMKGLPQLTRFSVFHHVLSRAS